MPELSLKYFHITETLEFAPTVTTNGILEVWSTRNGADKSFATNLTLSIDGHVLDGNCVVPRMHLKPTDILLVNGPPPPRFEKTICENKPAAIQKEIKNIIFMGDDVPSTNESMCISPQSNFLNITSGIEHDQGTRNTMEDASTVISNLGCKGSRCIRSDENNHIHFYAIFDGHGGSACANWLSQNLHLLVERFLISEVDVEKALELAFEEADRILVEEHPEIDSGSTCIAVLIEEATSTLWVANVGDSRCVLSSGGAVTALSIDHKPSHPPEEERIKAAGGWVSFGRVMGFLGVSRAFGDSEMKAASSKMIIATPEIQRKEITTEDDFLILACDGLWDVFENDDACELIRKMFRENKSCTQASKESVRQAIDILNTSDNVSVITVKLQ